jgi:hypothetical protein
VREVAARTLSTPTFIIWARVRQHEWYLVARVVYSVVLLPLAELLTAIHVSGEVLVGLCPGMSGPLPIAMTGVAAPNSAKPCDVHVARSI